MQPKSILKTSTAHSKVQSRATDADNPGNTADESQPLLNAADPEQQRYAADGEINENDNDDDDDDDGLLQSPSPEERSTAQRRFWQTLLYSIGILSLLIVILVLGGRELGIGRHRRGGGGDPGRGPPVGPAPPPP